MDDLRANFRGRIDLRLITHLWSGPYFRRLVGAPSGVREHIAPMRVSASSNNFIVLHLS